MLAENTLALDATIFRTYDIRGVVGETLTEEGVYLIGQALGSLMREQGDHQLVMARDARLSSPTLARALCAGMLATGCDIYDLGVAPTPLLYYATHILNISSGVMLTGSHNPPEYNGVKAVLRHVSLSEEQIHGLYQRIQAKKFVSGQGVYHQYDNLAERYIAEVCGNVRLSRPLKIVIDAANGVTGELAPALFRALGCDVQELFCEIDGRFPNHHADPSLAENLQDLIRVVQERNADIGLAFDGDGDRLGVVTNKGSIIWSDRLLMLFAQGLLTKNPAASVVYDVKCTNQLAMLIESCGGKPVMWKTGHSLIKAKLAETNALLAGEMSGHFFFKDRWYGFDDALYAGARLLEIIAEQTVDSETIFARIPNSINTPELKVAVSDKEKFKLMQALIDHAAFDQAKNIMTIDGLRVDFAEGWGLVRPSNTTPYLILRFEAINEAILQDIQTLFREWILSVRPDLALPF